MSQVWDVGLIVMDPMVAQILIFLKSLLTCFNFSVFFQYILLLQINFDKFVG